MNRARPPMNAAKSIPRFPGGWISRIRIAPVAVATTPSVCSTPGVTPAAPPGVSAHSTTRSSLTASPPIETVQPGHAFRPLIRARAVRASTAARSTVASAFASLRARVARYSSCTAPTSLPAAWRASTSPTTSGPSAASASCSSPEVSLAPIARARVA